MRRTRWKVAVVLTSAAVALAACSGGGDEEQAEDSGGGTDPGSVEVLLEGEVLDGPTAVAHRPGTDEWWVTNAGNDSITIVTIDEAGSVRTEVRRDAYAEHFVAVPSGIAFDVDGATLAVSNDSINELRDMVFEMNPERNERFRGNHFMGPTLFAADTFALAGQNKDYLDDWPQPGIGHDPPDDIPRHDCPEEYWSEEAQSCQWPREGSHLDMLHGNPLSSGIVHLDANAYLLLDGCGPRTPEWTCTGEGHPAQVDFNRDHQEGNGFHGDGVLRRFVDVPFTRVAGVPSGVFERDGWIWFSDTGAGVVRRFALDSGSDHLVVGPWYDGETTHGAQGPGITDWSHLEHGPGDGDDPETVDAWVTDKGDAAFIESLGERWIRPMETLAGYFYRLGSQVEEPAAGLELERPAGLAAGSDTWFVADHATGRIFEVGWDGEVVRTIETDRPGLAGLALTADGDTLVATDVEDDALLRIRLS